MNRMIVYILKKTFPKEQKNNNVDSLIFGRNFDRFRLNLIISNFFEKNPPKINFLKFLHLGFFHRSFSLICDNFFSENLIFSNEETGWDIN